MLGCVTAGAAMLVLVNISSWKLSGLICWLAVLQCGMGKPALYSTAVTATQYIMSPTSSTNGRSGNIRIVGMVDTAWLAT